MNKYIFRTIFYTTIVLAILALVIDYSNLSLPWIGLLFGLIVMGGVVSYDELKCLSDKDKAKLLGLPESFFKE